MKLPGLTTFLVVMAGIFCLASGHSTTLKNNNGTKPFFIKNGDKYTVTNQNAMNLHERLPAETFTVGVDRMSGEFFLQSIEPFRIEGKIYGDTKKQADRILNTFLNRDGSTGVLLTGEKGSGKTFLAKWIAIQAAKEHDIPTVVINQPLTGERFNAFIQSIQQPTIFLFDEFEKTYADRTNTAALELEMEIDSGFYHDRYHPSVPNPNQDSMLTLLDGTYPSRMLFLMTSNDIAKVSSHMRNRPGRIYYVIDFFGLSAAFVREYCEDRLQDKTMIPQIVAASVLFEALNFDMLQAIVEEMNRYGESPEQVLSYLNVRPELGRGSKYTFELYVNGKANPPVDRYSYYDEGSHEWQGNPFFDNVELRYVPEHQGRQNTYAYEDEEEFEPQDLVFTSNDIDGINATTGTFWYWKENSKARLVLKKDDRMRLAQIKGEDLARISKLGGKPDDDAKPDNKKVLGVSPLAG